ncbi:hypothetical protein LZ32DRAFT_172469 [Colletotrichum eremochloae]|nr:hypothetical protein LZ32DRAFT_172469 [Colletotrichum eremochloae]
MDDRSLVYAVGPRAYQSKRPLVFISFDPAIRLANTKYWPGGPMASAQTQPKTQGDNTMDLCPYPQTQPLPASKLTFRSPSFSEGPCSGPKQVPTDLPPDADRLNEPICFRKFPAAYLHDAGATGKASGFSFAYSTETGTQTSGLPRSIPGNE